MKRNNTYYAATTDFSIPSTHRVVKPEDSATPKYYLEPWYEVCLDCPLSECWRDKERDAIGYYKSPLKELCPIIAIKKQASTGEFNLSNFNKTIVSRIQAIEVLLDDIVEVSNEAHRQPKAQVILICIALIKLQITKMKGAVK